MSHNILKKCDTRSVYYLINEGTESTEYKIIVNHTDFEKVYKMYRIGTGWSEDAKGEPCAVLKDDGDGVSFKKIKKLDYSEFQEWALLFQFVFIYDKGIGDEYIIL
jgi:hypothetical protein